MLAITQVSRHLVICMTYGLTPSMCWVNHVLLIKLCNWVVLIGWKCEKCGSRSMLHQKEKGHLVGDCYAVRCAAR